MPRPVEFRSALSAETAARLKLERVRRRFLAHAEQYRSGRLTGPYRAHCSAFLRAARIALRSVLASAKKVSVPTFIHTRQPRCSDIPLRSAGP